MKNYLIISPQPWGKMYLSKHNYAIELSTAGNTVYFVNPPQYKPVLPAAALAIREELPGLFVVDYFLPSSLYILRFKARPVYDFVLERRLIRQMNKLASFDELWCFEPNVFGSLSAFNAKKKLLFLVDQHENHTLMKLASQADGIATISRTILDTFKSSTKPKLLLNHGLNKTFSDLALQRLHSSATYQPKLPLKVAYVGNLFQGERMDYTTLQKIVFENPQIDFHFFGPSEEKDNTLGTTLSEGLQRFIHYLRNCNHVTLHGVLPQTVLAAEMQKMDAFLNCYNYKSDPSKASNFHKLIEYLSTGRVVVSNRIQAYENQPALIEMPDDYTNENLPALFRQVISNIEIYNTDEKQKRRIEFALENTYVKHIESISAFLNKPALLRN